jgi:pimeloyl-ACP methyl ester carboxylesterase/membrane protein DedA with SNARE-associated domain
MTTDATTSQSRLRRWGWRIAVVYVALLMLSHLTRSFHKPDHNANVGDPAMMVQAVSGNQRLEQTVQLAYREYRPEDDRDHPSVVLLHGSPGSLNDFFSLAPPLAHTFRVIAPDLPGFGHSTHQVPDYSIRAHADYALQMLDRLNIHRAHLVGFSLGGGVALNVAERAPDRVASLTLLSSIGVQEMELLGDYHLNHLLHGVQLAGLWLLREATPHMGWLDDAMLSVEYARNFYDSDQRPLREMLARFGGPMLVIHGRRDVLVPVAAAIEHARLAPQSELQLYDDNHFLVFTKGPTLAEPIKAFITRVEQGQAITRANADPARLAQASLPYDPSHAPKAMGVTALVVLLLLAAATLVSEDLTCIGTGVMVAQGRIGFALGAFACFLGIFVGDILLFLAGRYLGRPALKRAPLRWFVRDEDVEKSSAWFARRGLFVIFASRFAPGARLPTYFAAGLLHTSFWWFSFYFFLASAVWTPLLVGLSSVLGAEVIESALLGQQSIFIKALIAAALIYLLAKLAVALPSYRGRRMLLSKWRRLTRWEFWPPWAFYPPVICYVAYLAVKHRGLTLFTAANPAIPGGGFVGESKAEILRGLAAADGLVARATLIETSLDGEARLEKAKTFMAENRLDFPVVLKPNQGQRGSGVAVARSDEELRDYLHRSSVDTIIQEHVAGSEFGVFYYRRPEEARGRIFSITEKRFPVVIGDGVSTLEQLILKDRRAVCMARFYLNRQAPNLWQVPGRGERVQLVELGTHCRGAIFLDGSWVKTEALEQAIDQISRGFDGFYFGRFDIRTPSIEDFKQGRNFKVIELNGVTSEATHIYDPKNSLLAAYRVLFEQWRIAFEIGAHNRQRGVEPTPPATLARWLAAYRHSARSHLS